MFPYLILLLWLSRFISKKNNKKTLNNRKLLLILMISMGWIPFLCGAKLWNSHEMRAHNRIIDDVNLSAMISYASIQSCDDKNEASRSLLLLFRRFFFALLLSCKPLTDDTLTRTESYYISNYHIRHFYRRLFASRSFLVSKSDLTTKFIWDYKNKAKNQKFITK